MYVIDLLETLGYVIFMLMLQYFLQRKHFYVNKNRKNERDAMYFKL